MSAKQAAGNKTKPAVKAAQKYARKLERATYGPVTIVRAVTQRYPSLRRRDVLKIAEDVGINAHTASRQFQEVRNGDTRVSGV